jgi:hypothetical protein
VGRGVNRAGGAGVPRSNVFGKLSMLGRLRLPVNPYRNAATVFSRFRTVFAPFFYRLLTVFHRFYRFLKNGERMPDVQRIRSSERMF